MHEIEAVGHLLAAGPERKSAARTAQGYLTAGLQATAFTARDQVDRDDQQPGDDHAYHPAADGQELRPLRVQQLTEPVRLGANRGAAPCDGAGHRATSARNSAASRVRSR